MVDSMNTVHTDENREMNIVIVGHVDHGKSTVIGRLLADTGSLPEGKLDSVRELCRRNSKPFEYAFLLDALKDERSQGITIDAARCFFKTEYRKYIIIDAPGHIEFLKNMITGASRADAALLVIDAHEGIRENSRRHGYLLAMLGIRQIAVLVNKMDLVGYDKNVFDAITAEYSEFLEKIGVRPECFIPISAVEGDNIAAAGDNMPWWNGNTVLKQLDAFKETGLHEELPLRMPVQDVYKFTSSGDDRRIVAGTVESGRLRVGDTVVFYPSGKKTEVKTVEAFNRPPICEASAGESTGFTVTEQIYIRRGELACRADERAPHTGCEIRTSLFWLGREPMRMGKNYKLKIGSAKVTAELASISYVLDASTLERVQKNVIEKHDVAECVIRTEKPIAFDLASEMPSTGRFVLVDGYEISGGGIITAAEEENAPLENSRRLVQRRNMKWVQSDIPLSEREKRSGQRAALVIITGERATGKKQLAKALERSLFDEGRQVYYLGMSNYLYGVAAEIKTQGEDPDPDRLEHIRRLGEVANLMLDAGTLLIMTAGDLSLCELEMIELGIEPGSVQVVWVGDNVTTDIAVDMMLPSDYERTAACEQIKEMLREKRIIFM